MRCFRCAEESADPYVLDVQPGGPGGSNEAHGVTWRVVVVCQRCFDELDPDMWICEQHWMAMNPAVPYDKLPPCKVSDDEATPLSPETYAAFAPPLPVGQ